MGDIQRSMIDPRINNDKILARKHTLIRLEEKKSQLCGLNRRIEDLKSIEMKKLELQKDLIIDDIKKLELKLKGLDDSIIEVEIVKENK